MHILVALVFNLTSAQSLHLSMQDVLGRSTYEDYINGPGVYRPCEYRNGYYHDCEYHNGRPDYLFLVGLAWTSLRCVTKLLSFGFEVRLKGLAHFCSHIWNWLDLSTIAGQATINVLFCLRDVMSPSVRSTLLVHYDYYNLTAARRLSETDDHHLVPPADAFDDAADWPPHHHRLRGLRASSMGGGASAGTSGHLNGAIIYLLSVQCLALCLRMLYFFRGSLKLGALSHAMNAIIVDILPLMVLLLLFVVAFCFAMTILVVNEVDSETGELYAWFDFWEGLLVMMNVGLYTYYDAAAFKNNRNFVMMVYHVYMILTQVVLLNMLIAVMNMSYTRVAEQSELVALSGRAKLILEYEAREVALQKRRVHRQARAKAALARMTLARMTLALASPLPLRPRAKAAQPS